MMQVEATFVWKGNAVSRIIESDIPGSVKSFEYVKNCHYLKLKDGKGSETTLIECGLIQYNCESCEFIFYSESDLAGYCPCCGKNHLTRVWVRPQVSLVPEKETDFALLQKKTDGH